MGREGIVLGAIIALAAALRFTKLGTQSFWEDETVTAAIVKEHLHTLLLRVRSLESTPPLYYVTAWAWSKAAGLSDVGLRSLSALLGTAVVPIGYLAARTLATRRAALVTGLFLALSPLLVWYSQEARAYTLLSLLCALSWLFFARTIRAYRPLELAGWSATSAIALTAHYFAAFLVAVEAVLLIRYVPRRRTYLAALIPVTAVGAALLPLLADQRGRDHASFIGEASLAFRLEQLGVWFASGQLRAAAALVAAALAAVLATWLLIRRTDRHERSGGLIALGAASAAVALPAVLIGVGLDYFLFRNLIASLVPLAIALAVGCTGRRAGRLGLAAATTLCVVFLVADIAVFIRPGLQRDDWRSVARIVTRSRGQTAVLVYPRHDARAMLHYAPTLALTSARTVRVRTVWFVGVHGAYQGDYQGWTPPAQVGIELPGGFRKVSEQRFQHFVIRRFSAARPLPVSVRRLERSVFGSLTVRVLVG